MVYNNLYYLCLSKKYWLKVVFSYYITRDDFKLLDLCEVTMMNIPRLSNARKIKGLDKSFD